MTFFNYIKLPVVSMRATPDVHSEVVSEALFAEGLRVLERQNNWLHIETCIDSYKGWIPFDAVCQSSKAYGTSKYLRVQRCAAHVYDKPDTIFGPIITLPFESRLELLDPQEVQSDRWLQVVLPDDRRGYVQRGDVTSQFQPISLEEVCKLSHFFLGLPYTWGGRSSFGFDCSGFVQMLYRQMGVHLPRDSHAQCDWGHFKKVSFEDLASGDLLFYGFSDDKIRHVGMYLGDKSFIHACASVENAPYVRISRITDKEWCGKGHYPYYTARRMSK